MPGLKGRVAFRCAWAEESWVAGQLTHYRILLALAGSPNQAHTFADEFSSNSVARYSTVKSRKGYSFVETVDSMENRELCSNECEISKLY